MTNQPHGLSAENRSLFRYVLAGPTDVVGYGPHKRTMLTDAEINRLLDAAREESAARVKAEVEESCSFWEPRPTTPAGAGELVEAWSYELASGIDLTDGSYVGWQRHITAHKPCVPDGSIRNLKPLYAATFIEQRSRVDREAVARLEAFAAQIVKFSHVLTKVDADQLAADIRAVLSLITSPPVDGKP